MMKPYRNPDSGVTAYEIHETYILLEFKGGKIYRYDQSCVGVSEFELMKKFAEKEDDLNTYINKNRHIYKCGNQI